MKFLKIQQRWKGRTPYCDGHRKIGVKYYEPSERQGRLLLCGGRVNARIIIHDLHRAIRQDAFVSALQNLKPIPICECNWAIDHALKWFNRLPIRQLNPGDNYTQIREKAYAEARNLLQQSVPCPECGREERHARARKGEVIEAEYRLRMPQAALSGCVITLRNMPKKSNK
jgi:hypothetical protein